MVIRLQGLTDHAVAAVEPYIRVFFSNRLLEIADGDEKEALRHG